jgi:hypothetical protein
MPATKPAKDPIAGQPKSAGNEARCEYLFVDVMLMSSGRRRFRRRARIEINAIVTNATRCSFVRSKMMFNRR